MLFSLDRLDFDAAWDAHYVRSACSSIIGDEVMRITVAFILVMEGAVDPPLEHRPQAVRGPPAVHAGADRRRRHGHLRGRAGPRLRGSGPADGRDRHRGGRQPTGPAGGGLP